MSTYIRKNTGNPDLISIKDFGAAGDDSNDDTSAFQAAIAQVIANTNSSGYSGGKILLPNGVYKITDELVIEAADAGTVNGISFIGEGGHTGEGSTILKFAPSSSKNGLVLKSAQGCRFEGIEFISANNNVDRLLYITSQPSPTFSSFQNTFENCSFRPFTSTTPSDKLISVAGGVLTSFKRCWFSGTDQVIGLGEFALAATTESGGGAGQTIFEQCEIYNDIEVQNAQNTTFINTVFGRKNTLDLVSIYPIASNFTRNDFMTFIGCSQVLNINGDDQTFWTQGAASDGLVALNNRFEGYARVFDFTGTGNALLAGNEYTPPNATAQAGSGTTITLGPGASDEDDFYNGETITITGGTGSGQSDTILDYDGSTKVATVTSFATPPDNTSTYNTTYTEAINIGANAEGINILSDNFESYVDNGNVGVDDNRIGTRLPLVVDEELDSDYTFTATGAFEDIITSNLRLRGGMYRVRYAVSLDSNAAANYTFRVTVDGAAINAVSTFKTVGSGEQAIFTAEALVNINGTTSAVDVKLIGQQSTGTLSDVKQNGTSYTTILQIEEA